MSERPDINEAENGVGGRTRTQKRLLTIALLCGANWIVWFWVSVAFGGVPDPERSSGGTYYVSSHGEAREVSEGTYRYLQIHGASQFVTFPIAFICGMLSLPHGKSGTGRT